MKFSGIIFDFNGTLFWDGDKQESSWRLFSEKLRGSAFTDQEMDTVVHGRTNASIIKFLVGSSLSEDKVYSLVQEKERIYRDMCLSDISNLRLAPGAEELLDYLAEHDIARTIATASEKTNVDFFIATFKLAQWFHVEKIIYDDGTFPGKPAPDIYIKAAKAIDLNPEQCIVVEDSLAGVESARQAGIGMIIAIGPANKHDHLKKVKGVGMTITDFNQLERDIFINCGGSK